MRYKVCNKWEIDVPDYALSVRSDNVDSVARPYTYYINRKSSDMGHQAWCREYLLEQLDVDGVNSVVEYFGGIGMDAAIVEGLLTPKRHTLIDLDAGCVNILRHNYPQATVIQGDATLLAGICAKLAICDFERFTMLHVTRNKNDVRDMLGYVLNACACCIITDSAVSRMHLNAPIYAKALHMQVSDITTYLKAMSMYFYNRYGFSVKMAAGHFHATYVMLTLGKYPLQHISYVKSPSTASECFRACEGS